MRPVHRRHVNKGKSSRSFARNSRTVASANMAHGLMRGGWRL